MVGLEGTKEKMVKELLFHIGIKQMEIRDLEDRILKLENMNVLLRGNT